MLPSLNDKRHCTRCKADIHAPDPPHLCKDIAARLARREKQVAAVLDILTAAGFEPENCKCGSVEESSVHDTAEECGCDFPNDHHEYVNVGRVAAEDIVKALANMGVQED